MSFRQWLKDKLKRGEKPTYIIRNVNKPPDTKVFKKRGVRWTRKDRSTSKSKRKMAKESQKRNRLKKVSRHR